LEEQIQFKNEQGETLAGTLHRPEQDDATRGVVLGHCFTCTRHTGILRRVAGELIQHGFIALRFDFSGNGQSQGDFADSTYSKQVSEMQSAMNQLADRGARWIALGGHSMGALIAFLTAVEVGDVPAVCTLAGRLAGMGASNFLNPEQRRRLRENGEVSFRSRGRELTVTDRFFEDARRFDPTRALREFRRPLLIVHGSEDEIIPVQEATRAHEIGGDNVTLEIIPDADHMFGRREDAEKVARLVTRWYENQSGHRTS
jgi:putative redox protein